MLSITLTQSNAQSTRPGNYLVTLAITSAESITSFLFVKKRIIRPDGSSDDTFVTVASPAQIEDIPQQVPGPDDPYWRDDTITLVSSDPDLLNDVISEITEDIQLTLIEATDLQTISSSQVITITPTSIS